MRTEIYNLNMRVGTGIRPTVKMSQYDVARTIGFRLYDGELAYNPGANAVVKITGTKPSGLGFTVNCSMSGSVAVVSTTLEMTQESGQINAELRVTEGSMDVGTSNFILYIEPAPHPDGTIDGNMDTIDDFGERLSALESTVDGLDAYVFTDPQSDGNIIVSVRM